MAATAAAGTGVGLFTLLPQSSAVSVLSHCDRAAKPDRSPTYCNLLVKCHAVVGTCSESCPTATLRVCGHVYCSAISGVGAGSITGVCGSSATGYGVYGSSGCNVGVVGSSVNNIGVLGTTCGCRCDFGFIGVKGTAAKGVGVSGCSCNGVGVSAKSVTGLAICALTSDPMIARLANSGKSKNKSAGLQFQNGCSTPGSWFAGVGGAGNAHGLENGQFYFLEACHARVTFNKCGNVGIGTIAPSTTLDVNGSISAKAVNVTAKTHATASTDFAIFADAESNDVSIDLPLASAAFGRVLFIKRIDDKASNTVTVSRSGTNTIEGKTSISLSSQYASLTLISNGNGWFILSNAI